jgi:hypothetical protein
VGFGISVSRFMARFYPTLFSRFKVGLQPANPDRQNSSCVLSYQKPVTAGWRRNICHEREFARGPSAPKNVKNNFGRGSYCFWGLESGFP